MANPQPNGIIESLLPAGDPKPGVPFADAVARKLGLDSPMGKTAYYGQFRSSYPTQQPQHQDSLYPMLREEMVSKLAQKNS
jgi:hypothetical protein